MNLPGSRMLTAPTTVRRQALRPSRALALPFALLWSGTIWCLSLTGMMPEAHAQTVAEAFANDYDLVDLGSVPGVPAQYGGLTFRAGDPNTLLIGGSANNNAATIHAITVVRDASRHITGFSGTSRVFANAPGLNNAGGIDGGLTYGPNNVLFYTSYSDNSIGQIKPGSTSPDKIIGLSALGISSSVGSLMFVPPGQPGAGRLKILSYNASTWYDTTATADSTGTFTIAAPARSVVVGGGPEGVIYVPGGSPLFTRPSILLSEYSNGKVGAFEVNTNGDPVPATRRDFVTGLSGAEGAAVDPVTGDFLFSTFGGGNKVIAVRGFAAPPVNVTITSGGKVNEGDTGSVNATFTITLAPVSTRTVTVNYTTANGTASAGSDFTTTPGTLTFSPGQTSKTITVPVLGDTIDEPDETFLVRLSNPSGGVLVNSQAETVIVDNDGTQTLSINDVTLAEGNSGTVNAIFRVTLSSASSREISVNFATANGTASAGSDYTSRSGTLTLPAGQLFGNITVPILGDTTVEPNETFFVNLSRAVNATLADAQGIGTITNDDIALPKLHISSVSLAEGDAGNGTMYFSVRLSRPASRTVSVRYATANGGAVSTAPVATAGSDYTSRSGTLTLAAGQLFQVVQVLIQGDTIVEQDEQFSVILSNPVGADIGTTRGIGTILNDDSAGGVVRSAPSVRSNAQPGIRTSAASGILALKFATALDAQAATDVLNYRVQINGRNVPVLDVETDAGAGLVFLLLPEGALADSDGTSVPVAVTWQIQSANGTGLQGTQTTVSH